MGFVLRTVNMVKRVCRHCPVPDCGARYLVRLTNHLADVHLLDTVQRRKYLQEAKLQPKIKFVVYQNKDTTDENNINTPKQQERVYVLSQPRQHNIGKAAKTKVKHKNKVVKNYKVREQLKNWLTV